MPIQVNQRPIRPIKKPPGQSRYTQNPFSKNKKEVQVDEIVTSTDSEEDDENEEEKERLPPN